MISYIHTYLQVYEMLLKERDDRFGKPVPVEFYVS